MCERVIEIGPSNTLTTLLKKTLASKSDTFDKVHSIQRQFLSISKDANDIFYHADAAEPAPEVTKRIETSSSSSTDLKATPVSSPAAVVQATSTERASQPTAAIEDKPVTVSQIVRSLISQKLQKLPQQIGWDGSIKGLVGGEFAPIFPCEYLIPLVSCLLPKAAPP